MKTALLEDWPGRGGSQYLTEEATAHDGLFWKVSPSLPLQIHCGTEPPRETGLILQVSIGEQNPLGVTETRRRCPTTPSTPLFSSEEQPLSLGARRQSKASTVLLIRGFQVVAVAQQRAHRLAQAVLV